ncbi:unnamed protein product [Brassica rapa subsp. trilocularis]
MDDESRRGNLRRRARQINGEDVDRPTNRRRQNELQNDGVQAGDHVEPLPLELSLGSTSHSSQIPPMTTSSLPLAPPSPFALPLTTSSLPLAPASPFAPPMTTWQTSGSIAQYFASSQSHYMTYPPYLSNSIYQTRPSTPMQPPFGQSFNLFPSSSFVPTRPVMRPAASGAVSRRSYRSQSSVNRNDDTIPPPFPWATNKRGWIQSLENLASKQITTITGEVQCKHCEKVYQVSYNLREKFSEVENIFVMGKWIMRERAPPIWTNPEPARCDLCGRDKAVKPVIAERKYQINWLFLLLGQTLGFCTLEQLKNFCKHSRSHRTGAKNRVLYLTYLGLCKMLEPNRELFQRETARREGKRDSPPHVSITRQPEDTRQNEEQHTFVGEESRREIFNTTTSIETQPPHLSLQGRDHHQSIQSPLISSAEEGETITKMKCGVGSRMLITKLKGRAPEAEAGRPSKGQMRHRCQDRTRRFISSLFPCERS